MDGLDLVINIGILFAAAITATATYRSWKSQEKRDRANMPTVHISETVIRRRNDLAVLSFSLEAPHRAVWRLESVSIRRPIFGRMLQYFKNPDYNVETGEPIYSASSGWHQSVQLRRDIIDHLVFVKADRPRSASLSFNICMKADSSQTSRFIERISITD